MPHNTLLVHPGDNIATALNHLPANTSLEMADRRLNLVEDIPVKHKFALDSLKPGDQVYMYGVLVGVAIEEIAQGARITTSNLKHAAEEYSGKKAQYQWQAPDVTAFAGRSFMGYHRKNGKVGTMNQWLVVPLVFCENRNIKVIEAAMKEQLGYPDNNSFKVNIDSLISSYKQGASTEELLQTPVIQSSEQMRAERIFPNVDGLKFLTHSGGCGGTRQDAEALCRLLAGYITHPNVGGATVLSLGCQNAQIQLLEDAIAEFDPGFDKPLVILEQQQSKSERDLIENAVKQTFVGLAETNRIERKPAPLSKLVLGLECGGSDGFSGISANPALGYTSDMLVALGGTTILSEFPELNGVEQELIDRCDDEQLAEKFAHLMRTYNERAKAVGSGFENNPSPGNIKDGLITDAIKSAGAARKGGTSPVKDVLDYTEQVDKTGLNLLCTPGNDVESTTALAGSGANLIVFTTGLGTPTGNPITPVVKMSSNTMLKDKMGDIIDIDAGTIIDGKDSLRSKGEELLDYLIQVASGEATPAAVRLLQDDFIPWKRGVSL